MGLFSNPLGYAGYPPNAGPPANVVNSTVRAATVAEAAAGTLNSVYISPATEASSVALDFASPPVGGFGSTTPRPVHATTLSSTGTTSLGTNSASAIEVGVGSSTIGFYGATPIVIPAATTDLRTALINLGLYTTGGATPLNLNGGAFSAGTVTSAGAVTATNGNIVRGTAGNKDIYSSVASTTTAGANSAGTVALSGGTATVATTAITASSQVRLYRQGIGATGAAAMGILTLGTVTAGVSFVINSVQLLNATALLTADVSVIGWEIVN